MMNLGLLGLLIAVVVFGIGWAICARIGNYGFLDAIWTLSIGGLASLYSWLGSGTSLRRCVFAGAALVWSLRLGGYIALRVGKSHPREDPRYRSLRERWGSTWGFLLFFELQAIIAFLFSVPFLLASMDGAQRLSSWEVIGLGLALAATAGEAIADYQAQRFKKARRERRGQNAILDTGLWRYSRHPNYFFESLVWWGFAIAALGFPWGRTTLLCPILMLYFLLRVTGIPLTEKHSIESHGEAYRNYQRRTSRFIPWLPR